MVFRNLLRKAKILVPVVALLCGTMPVMAAETPTSADFERDTGSISVEMKAYGTDEAVSGGSLALYKVADVAVTEQNYEFVYTDDFAGCDEELLAESELLKAETADTFAEAASGKTAVQTMTVGSDGSAVFTNVGLGLYLVTQPTAADGYLGISPFLVTVPMMEDGEVIYDVDASPKTTPVQKETTPTTKAKKTGGTSGGTGGYNGRTTGAKTADVLPFVCIGAVLVAAAAGVCVGIRRRYKY